MEELGPDTARYHVDVGRSLALRQGDRLVAIGGQAEAVRQGAIESGASPDQVDVAESIDPLTPGLATFRGSVFVKGSRRHGLERAFAGSEHAEAPHA
jgi:UDP-N-acetylmuramyl pentapeptide synthase